jgi:hypothetical protein
MASDPRQRNEFLSDEGVPANRHVNLKAWGEPEGVSPGEWQESGRVRASGSVSSMRMTSRRTPPSTRGVNSATATNGRLLYGPLTSAERSVPREEASMKNEQGISVGVSEEPKVSLFLVFGCVLCGLNVIGVLIALMMLG